MQEILKDMVEKYSDKIYRLALRYTGDREQARDITQDTFLRAYKKLDKFDRSKSAGPWLFKIATNLCRNWLRDNREVPVESLDEFNMRAENSPESIVIRQENDRELAEALDRLPIMYREVILMKHAADMSYADIADVLGLKLSLVKNRLYRGRMLLRDLLEKESV